MIREHGYRLFIIILLCSLVLLLRLLWAYISAIVLALLVASVFRPIYTRLHRLLRGRANLAALLMCLFVVLALVLPLSWFVGTLSNEAFDFYKRATDAVSLRQIVSSIEQDTLWGPRLKRLAETVGVSLSPETLEQLAASVGKRVGLFLYRQLSGAASNLLSLLVHFFLMMLMIFYFFRDGEKLRDYLVDHLPLPRGQLEKLGLKFTEMGRAIVLGNGLSGVVQGILGGAGFFFFGLHAPFLWGTVIAVMAFLPIIGASVVFVPAALILFFQGEASKAVGYLIYNLTYSSIMEYLVKPRTIGKGMEMNALLVFIGIIGGIKLFGIMGIIYGPLIITVFLTLAEIYRLEYRQKPA